VGRKLNDLNWKVVGTYLILVTSIVMGIVFEGDPGQNGFVGIVFEGNPVQTGSIGVFLVRYGVLITVVFALYRKLWKKTSGQALSTIEANLKPIFVYSLISLSLITCFIFFLPSLNSTPNPDYDPVAGPVIVQECAYDAAQGEICGDKDLNPEFLQGGENFRVFVAALISGIHFFFYAKGTKWLKTFEVTEVNGHKICRKAKLDGVDLSNQNLTKARMSDANLTNANLAGAKLVRAELSMADMRGANLSGANLRGANLQGANLEGADLSNTSLREANFSGATMPDGSVHGN